MFGCPYKRRDSDGRDGSGQPKRKMGCCDCGSRHRLRLCRCIQQGNTAKEMCTDVPQNHTSNPGNSKDARMSSTIFPTFLAIPVSAPLSLADVLLVGN